MMRSDLESQPFGATAHRFRRALGLAVALLCLAGGAHLSDARPNFIFIYTDDQRWDAMGVEQADLATRGLVSRAGWFDTPGFDRLASEGVRFRNAFVTLSLCSPSRSAFLTGRYPHNTGMINNGSTYPDTLVNWATILGANGYTTGYVGKFHHANANSSRPGFQKLATYDDQGDYDYTDLSDGDPRNEEMFIDGINSPSYLGNPSAAGYSNWTDDVMTDFAMEFIKTEKQNAKPWAMVLGYKSPHVPRPPAPRNTGLYPGNSNDPNHAPVAPVPNLGIKPPFQVTGTGGNDELVRVYNRCVKGIDDNITRLLDFLDAEGLAGNTVVVFTSDNGYYWNEHDTNDKRSAYEESIRIPLLVRYPGIIPAGSVRDEIVLNIDVAPTFLDIAGLEVPADMDGRSFYPISQGQMVPDWRENFLYEFFLNAGSSVPDIVALRTKTAKLVTYPGRPWWNEMFDLVNDPYETTNIIDSTESGHSELLAKLTAEFDAEARRVGLTMNIETFELNDGTFTADFHGGMGLSYRLQRSTDLTHWQPIGDEFQLLTNTGGDVTLVDSGATEERVFYRAVLLDDPETSEGDKPPTSSRGPVIPASVIYHFEGNSNDSSTMDNNGTLQNGASFSSTSKVGAQSLLLDGVNDRMSIAKPVIKLPFSQRTVACWIKANSAGGKRVVFDEGGKSGGLAIRLNGGSLEAAVSISNSPTVVSTPYASTDWNHVAVVFFEGALELYLNGALVDSDDSGAYQVGVHNALGGIGARLGQDAFGGTGDGDYFGGMIDEFQIFEFAVNPAEVAALP